MVNMNYIDTIENTEITLQIPDTIPIAQGKSKEIKDCYLAFQMEVLTRRTIFDKKKAEARAHILEGLRIALDNIDEIIHIIRNSYNDAKERLMERFALSEIQAQAILDMQLRRLQGLEKEKIDAEYAELQKKIAYYKMILADRKLMLGVIKDEIKAIGDNFIIFSIPQIDSETLHIFKWRIFGSGNRTWCKTERTTLHCGVPIYFEWRIGTSSE